MTQAEPPVNPLDRRLPDVVVAWLQNDFGQFGRSSEAIAYELSAKGLARKVSYVEPQLMRRRSVVVRHSRQRTRGVDVHEFRGRRKLRPERFGRRVLERSAQSSPVLLNFGVADTNWYFHEAFSRNSSTTVLVAYDKLHLWPGITDEQHVHLRELRARLIESSDAVVGLSEGAIDDVPGAHYVGHGCDDVWANSDIDRSPEPDDLSGIPHPRAIYVGALSVRICVEALEAVAASGIDVVLVGPDPDPAVRDLIARNETVHFLGPRLPHEVATYLLHCDIGIVPHTDEPFTYSMEPHKVYNYACAGLRSVTLHCATPPRLAALMTSTHTLDHFVHAVDEAKRGGRLDRAQVRAARSLTWGNVASEIMRLTKTQ
jgi:glycosyltransferase involved in cell wall biosynthesis